MGISNATATISLTANNSALAAGLRASTVMVGHFAKATSATLAAIGSAPANMAIGLGRSVGALAQFGLAKRGLDALTDTARGVMDFERRLTRFGIATRQGKEGLDQVRRAARATSVATGIDAVEVLNSARAYVDLAGAQNTSIAKMNILSRAGAASEAEGKDLAGMMYQLTRSMKVTDDQMEDTMGGLINQAKDGAIEAKQMAAEFAGMMPIFARFGIIGREGAVQLGAMYQVTRDGFDSAAQAQTGMIRLMAGLQRHASRFAEHGVQVFKPGSKKDLRDLSDIIQQIKTKGLSKDIEALIKAFGRSEAWRTFELLEEAPDRLKELEAAGRVNNVIAKDLATFTSSAAGKMDVAGEKMKNAFAEVLTPERVDQIASGMASIANSIGPVMKAIDGVASGFSRFVHGVARAKNWMQGDSEYQEERPDETPTEALARMMGLMAAKETHDEAILRAEETAKAEGAPIDPEFQAKADAIRKRRADYNKSIKEILTLEDDFGPTDASIKKAIEMSRRYMNPNLPSQFGDTAAINYLKARGENIPDTQYKRIEDSVLEEEKKKAAALTGWGFDPTEKFNMQQAATQQFARETLKPMMDSLATKIGDTVGRAISGKPTQVHIDGNPVAKAGGDATDRRRK